MDNGLHLGIMSGTSMDGIDDTLVEFHPQGFSQLASHSRP